MWSVFSFVIFFFCWERTQSLYMNPWFLVWESFLFYFLSFFFFGGGGGRCYFLNRNKIIGRIKIAKYETSDNLDGMKIWKTILFLALEWLSSEDLRHKMDRAKAPFLAKHLLKEYNIIWSVSLLPWLWKCICM